MNDRTNFYNIYGFEKAFHFVKIQVVRERPNIGNLWPIEIKSSDP